MSRHPQIKSRQRDGGRYYYCQYRGRQYGLGYDLGEARKLFARIIGDLPRELIGGVTIGELASWFEAWSAKFSAKRTAEDYGYWISRFVAFVGPDLPALEVRPWQVDYFVLDASKVGGWAHVKIVRSIKRLYRWAKDQGHLEFQTSPLAGLKAPPDPESPQIVLSSRQIWFAWRAASRDFRPVLRFWYHTGCRPEEPGKIKCSWVDTKSRMITIPSSKAKKRISRHIPYPSKLDRMISRCMERSKTGKLFETARGGSFTRWTIDTRHDRIRMRQPALFPGGFYARLWRYTFATRAIKAGMDIVTLSHIMGHKDLSMLRKHYEKLGADRAHLAGAVDRISRGRR